MQQNKENTDWWDELSRDEQEELDIAIEESFDEKNWVSQGEAMATIEKWLRRERGNNLLDNAQPKTNITI